MKIINNTITLPAGLKMHGTIEVISSKSHLHRLIFCACLSDKATTIRYNSELSKDIIATIGCFEALGAKISVEKNSIKILRPIRLYEPLLAPTVFCNESGSTARFILPLLSLICKNGATMTGAGKLPTRPFEDLCRCLSQKGAVFSSTLLPIEIKSCICPEGEFVISGNVSSQYLSGLLFILPLCKNARIRLSTPLESSGYVDMTIKAMSMFGVKVCEQNGVYTCEGYYSSPNEEIIAEGDWSNAAFFLCGAAFGCGITLSTLDTSSKQPDKAIIDILSGVGYSIEACDKKITSKRGATLLPFDINATETPDLVPVLCVLAASVVGKSTIKGIHRLRFKESDRVKAVCDMITALGGDIFADNDSIYINGTGTLEGGTVCGYNDHRIVMSAAIASTICKNPVTITDANAISKSYPEFFEAFKSLTEEDT